MSAVEINGTRLEYIERGDGDPVVFVHGTLGDYRSWEPQMDVFAESYRAISYSRRYHHPNPCRGDESDYSAALHADDLAAFIAGLGPELAHVVGTSYGAYTALLLAACHPERVRGLVLGDPPVLPLLNDTSGGRALRDEFLESVWECAGDMARRGEIEGAIRVFVDGVVAEGAYDSFPGETQSMIQQNACEFKVETSSPDFWTPFTCEQARQVTTPTLLLTGDRSLEMFQLIVDELARCLPNNESKQVPETTHLVNLDNPDAYNDMVLGFLARHSET